MSVGLVNGLGNMAFAFNQKVFPILVGYLTFYGTFYFYAAMTFVISVWGLVSLKVTDGLSLVDTECLYDGRMKKKCVIEDHSKKDSC